MCKELNKYQINSPNRKKPIAFLLLIIISFNIFGYYFCFHIIQSGIRREMQARIREGIDESELAIIAVLPGHEAAIKWIKPGKEFTYHGNLYDVVKLEIRNGKKIYHCINDTREEKLISAFSGRAEANQKARKIINSLSSNYFAQIVSFFHFQKSVSRVFYDLYSNFIPNIREVSDPPPKF